MFKYTFIHMDTHTLTIFLAKNVFKLQVATVQPQLSCKHRCQA